MTRGEAGIDCQVRHIGDGWFDLRVVGRGVVFMDRGNYNKEWSNTLSTRQASRLRQFSVTLDGNPTPKTVAVHVGAILTVIKAPPGLSRVTWTDGQGMVWILDAREVRPNSPGPPSQTTGTYPDLRPAASTPRPGEVHPHAAVRPERGPAVDIEEGLDRVSASAIQGSLDNLAGTLRRCLENTEILVNQATGAGARPDRETQQLSTLNRVLESQQVKLKQELLDAVAEKQVLERQLAAIEQRGSPSDDLVETVSQISASLRQAASDLKGDDPLTDEQAEGLGQYLPRLEQLPDPDTARDLRELSATLLSAAGHPLDLADRALKDGDVGTALRQIASHMSNPALGGASAKGHRYYSERLKVIAVQLWRDHAGSPQLDQWLPRTLSILGLEMIVPEVGRTFSPKTQIAVDRRPGNESQPRNSILEVVEPGFKRTDTGKLVSKPKVVTATQ